MMNKFGKKGFRSLILRIIIYVLSGLLLGTFILLYFRHTTFFQQYLTIPGVFQLEKPHFRTTAINALLLGIVSFIILTYKQIANIKYYKIKKEQILFIITSSFFLFFQYLYKFLINQNLAFFLQTPVFWGVVKIFINIAFIISFAFGIFGRKMIFDIFRNFKKEIYIFMGVVFLFYWLIVFTQNMWIYFSKIVSESIFWIFQLFSENVYYGAYNISNGINSTGGPILRFESFSAIVGKSCSGIDSFLLFTTLFLLLIIIDRKKIFLWKSIISYFIGIIGMLFTNILRVAFLFVIGAYWSPKLATGLFHTNLGWLLFILYFFIFWTIASKVIYKTKITEKKEK